jgi:hypothetical protein
MPRVSAGSGPGAKFPREPEGGSILKIIKLAAACTLCRIALLAAPVLPAQQPVDPPSAPVPTQILSGKKVFISNASGQGAAPSGVPDLTYNEFYADIKNWGRYEIVSAPADADLVFEIRFTSQIGTTTVMSGTGGSGQDFQFRLVILDPKTRTVLWAFTESVPQAASHSASRKKFDDAMAAIVNDVKKLASQATAANVSAPK